MLNQHDIWHSIYELVNNSVISHENLTKIEPVVFGDNGTRFWEAFESSQGVSNSLQESRGILFGITGNVTSEFFQILFRILADPIPRHSLSVL